MHLLDAPITGRRDVARGMVVIAMEAAAIASSVRAGQFVNLGWSRGPLLRRPFSVYRVDGDRIEVVLKEVGAGTAQLLAMEPGDGVSCLGPLGHGFELKPGPRTIALVSGGLGVAPMPMAARQARAMGLHVCWVHGARTAADLCSEWEGDEICWATEDGSRGVRGTALEAVPEPAGQVLACGPVPMLAALARRWPEAQVAVETVMGCGTGVCLGCAVPLTSGVYTRACTEGPVYRAGAVAWERLPAPAHAGWET